MCADSGCHAADLVVALAHAGASRDPGTDGGTINEHLLDAIREFTGAILNPFDLEELLHRLTRQATAVVDAVGAGIMLIDENGRLSFVAASEQLVVEAERHQHDVRQGGLPRGSRHQPGHRGP